MGKARILFITLLLALIGAASAQAEPLAELLAGSPLAEELPRQAVDAAWSGETLSLSVGQALSDRQALGVSWQITPNTQAPCYLTLEKVYVNGQEVPLTRSILGGPNWLGARACAGLWDMSQVPQAESYTVVMSFLSLKPAGEVTWLDSPDDQTDYMAYQQSIIDLNNAGYVVTSPEGYILLSPETYDGTASYPYQLLEAGKMTPWENPAVTFTLAPGIACRTAETVAELDGYQVEARAAWSPLSLCLTVTQTFSNTFTQAEAEAALRRYAVMDGRGGKNWYTGSSQILGEIQRQGDGSWRGVYTWRTQSLLSLPEKLTLTPYTYDAAMSPLYEKDAALTLTLE